MITDTDFDSWNNFLFTMSVCPAHIQSTQFLSGLSQLSATFDEYFKSFYKIAIQMSTRQSILGSDGMMKSDCFLAL